jgi:hypothetical protein
VPTADGDTFWGYSAVPAEDCRWWSEKSTYEDPAREATALRVQHERAAKQFRGTQTYLAEEVAKNDAMRKRLKQDVDMGRYLGPRITDGEPANTRERYLRASDELARVQVAWLDEVKIGHDLRWQVERRCYPVAKPFTLHIWGTKTVDAGGGYVLRSGEEQPREVKPGDYVAVCNGRALLVERGREDAPMNLCYSITDHDQDGDAAVRQWLKEGLVSPWT